MDNYNSQLYERAKELECLYRVDEVLQNKSLTLPAAMKQAGGIDSPGLYRHPAACKSHYGIRFTPLKTLGSGCSIVRPHGSRRRGREIAVGCICEL